MTKGERTRQRILDAAAELFSRSGYRAVSLRDIASHAGLTHAGVLHHFPNKEATLLDVLGRRDAIDAPKVLDPDLSSRERIGNVVSIVERNAGTPGLVSLYVNLSAEATDPAHPAHTYFTRRYELLRDHLTAAFTDLLDDGDEPSPELAAQQFLALQDGLQIQWLLNPDAVDMRAAVTSYLRGIGIELTDAPHPSSRAPGSETPARGPEPAPPH
ncbi:TetR/AcrR family transcriptional regulator [Nocardiopsis sp. HNM0947]|uniref:TetR/AcrR family transcriptional regulator n=2 Tax=Nocardiopsis coralli TaxID=2772213 RepID=A0ABR9PAL8_9ACTN|nr:TetR/AcrR family transcriptional regulator [Nocardiopsis coralli]MBE3000878.1 TetR/AcrR family transcriptional regulator [Nocardiopsis coralli]